MSRVAIVTGASSGFGKALCLKLAEEGYQLGILARNQGALEILAKEIQARGQKVLVCPCDVVDNQQILDSLNLST